MTDNPFVKPTIVEPRPNADGNIGVVVLDRIEPGVTPDYCTHGKCTCHRCDEWCWLGSETYKLVVSGEVAPLCHECAVDFAVYMQREHGIDVLARPRRNAGDHRRADGPHD